MKEIKLPYGIDNFVKLRESGCYYIDKTDFLKELLSETFDVNLITRPRRFGKTLTMSMLAAFLDIRRDSRELFHGLAISQDADFCAQWMNQWPVLFLTLKDVEGGCFQDAYGLLKYVISRVCVEHAYLARSAGTAESDKAIFRRLLYQSGDMVDVQCALNTLLCMMRDHYGKPVVLLVDEYDVPLAKASDYGYYGELLNVIRTFLGMVWKSNPALKCAVAMGCREMAEKILFAGSNNCILNSISDEYYQEWFGFSEKEVRTFLADTGFLEKLPELRKGLERDYGGKMQIYCPGKVMDSVQALLSESAALRP